LFALDKIIAEGVLALPVILTPGGVELTVKVTAG
jgi:hypothetical protein